MDELIERLRRLDPVPTPLAPPPIRTLLGDLDEHSERDPESGTDAEASASHHPRRGRRSRARATLRHIPVVVAAAISVLVAVFALLVLRHPHVSSRPPSPSGSAPAASGPPTFPPLSGHQRKQIDYVMKAGGTVSRQDSACAPLPRSLGNPGRAPSLSSGSPSATTLATIGTLRRSATSHDQLPPRELWHGPHSHPRIYRYGTYPPVIGIYEHYIRYARHRDGANYYLVPAANVNLQIPLPERCYSEQITALKHELPGIPHRLRAGILALQATYLAYQRASTVPYPGVCLAALNSTGNGDGASCFANSTIASGHTLTSGAPGGVPVVYGLAPDGVRSVVFYYRHRDPRHPLTATVINNVFILHNPHQRLPSNGFPTKLVWHDASGRVLKTITWS